MAEVAIADRQWLLADEVVESEIGMYAYRRCCRVRHELCDSATPSASTLVTDAVKSTSTVRH